MNFKQLLHHFIEQLTGVYDEQEVVSIFNLLVEHFHGLSRNQLLLQSSVDIDAVQEQAYLDALEDLKQGKPVQYILGEADFYGLIFKVSPAVLIPRPETEELVAWVIESNRSLSARIIDIGTGSGCIAISLKKNMADAEVSALDVSLAAIQIAEANAAFNQVVIDFIHEDILTYRTDLKFDVIVSNPPYIKLEEQAAMHKNVLNHEPHLALFVPDEKPLIFYEVIADFARLNLNENGLLFFEINADLGEATVNMLAGKSFKNIVLKKDMQGKDRMICCELMH